MAGEAGRDARAWLAVNETAVAFLSRSLSSRPPITLPPPLHRAPLRPGNVVEIAGPSNSGKSHLLLMAAVQCILPKEWEGIYFGGLGRAVMYLDLDCRFDVLRLVQILRNRIAKGCRSAHLRNGDPENDGTKDEFQCSLENTLFSDCMQRFLYARCCNSLEFIAALKTVQSQSRREVSGAGIYFVMIDRNLQHMGVEDPAFGKGKGRTLQSITESVVHELRKLLQLQPALVLVTKAPIYGEGTTTANDFNRNETVSHVQTSPMRAFQPDQRVYFSKADVNPDTA
uniref:RecA family profile 1 domain-containing protein n=1 Tax=Saccharum hybrid cultivar R570 TaxID=131158 RepID=A0A059Q0I8_9POAL|nr:hypothetical protein SHCRBa_170_F15_F_60 [Saccharum hybrid cultivar R570]